MASDSVVEDPDVVEDASSPRTYISFFPLTKWDITREQLTVYFVSEEQLKPIHQINFEINEQSKSNLWSRLSHRCTLSICHMTAIGQSQETPTMSRLGRRQAISLIFNQLEIAWLSLAITTSSSTCLRNGTLVGEVDVPEADAILVAVDEL